MPSSGAPAQRAWKIQVAIFSGVSALGLGVAIYCLARGAAVGVVIFTLLAAFEAWRAANTFKSRPASDQALTVEDRRIHLIASMRKAGWRSLVFSLLVLAVATVGAVTGNTVAGLWVLGGVLTAASILVLVEARILAGRT